MNFINILASSVKGFWPYLRSKEDSDFGVFLRIGNFEIRWYAILILTGALLCLWRAHYELKRRKMPEDYYDNFFLSVIPISIIGARVWYVISQIDEFKTASGSLDFLAMLGYNKAAGMIELSGLAIQGGVIFGVIWGVIYFKKIKTRYPLGLHFDLIVPSILIGQIVGRWGNFFNGEVYGKFVNKKTLWWIPKFIVNKCTLGSIGSQAGSENVHLPLFYIEGIINLVGFILIGVIIWRYWKKFRKPYCVGALYFIWYGVVRLCLEPLRDDKFIMQNGNVRTSILMSILYIIFGVCLFIFAQIYFRKVPYEKIYVNEAAEALEKEKQEKDEAILNQQIEAKKAEIRARKAKEKENKDE